MTNERAKRVQRGKEEGRGILWKTPRPRLMTKGAESALLLRCPVIVLSGYLWSVFALVLVFFDFPVLFDPMFFVFVGAMFFCASVAHPVVHALSDDLFMYFMALFDARRHDMADFVGVDINRAVVPVAVPASIVDEDGMAIPGDAVQSPSPGTKGSAHGDAVSETYGAANRETEPGPDKDHRWIVGRHHQKLRTYRADLDIGPAGTTIWGLVRR